MVPVVDHSHQVLVHDTTEGRLFASGLLEKGRQIEPISVVVCHRVDCHGQNQPPVCASAEFHQKRRD
eukprot:2906867-Pleurochrysis_carterae.AAC.3